MPAVIGGILGGGFFGTIVGQVVTLAVLGAVSRKLSPKSDRPGQNSDYSRDITTKSTEEYENFVYGKALVGGLSVYKNAVDVGSANDRMYEVIKWVGHKVNCFELYRFDDYTFDPSVDSWSWDTVSYSQGNAPIIETGRLRGDLNFDGPTAFRTYRGDQSSADNGMAGNVPDWSVDHVGADRAYGVLVLRAVNEGDNLDKAWPHGLPSNKRALVHGKSVYDHRYYALNGDPGFTNVDSTWDYWSRHLNSGDGAWNARVNSWPVALQSGVGGSAYESGVTSLAQGVPGRPIITEPIRCSVNSTYTLYIPTRVITGAFSGYTSLYASFWDGDGNNIPVSSSDAVGWLDIGNAHARIDAQVGSNMQSDKFSPESATRYIGSGFTLTVPTCASFMRLGLFIGAASDGMLAMQDWRVWLGTGSAQLVDDEDTWKYRTNPGPCIADYLRNEKFGFGKESRLHSDPTFYACNGDSGFRRFNTMNVTSWWRDVAGSDALVNPAGDHGSLNLSISDHPTGLKRAFAYPASGGSPADGSARIHSELFPVHPSGHYVAGAWIKTLNGGRRAIVNVRWSDADGDDFSEDTVSASITATTWSYYVAAFGSGTGTAVPSSARFAQIKLYSPRSWNNGGADVAFYANPVLQPGTTIKQHIEPWEQIHWSSVNSYAENCDGIVHTPSGTQARWTMNGEGHTGKPYRANLTEMLATVPAARLVYGPKGFQLLGGWEEPEVTLRRQDLAGPIKIQPEFDTKDRYNHVRGMFFDKDQDYGKWVPYANVFAAEYLTRDNSIDLFENRNFLWTNDWFEVQRNAYGILDQGDNQVMADIPVKAVGAALSVGRHVKMTESGINWQAKDFMITDATFDVAKQRTNLRLREDFEASYTDPSTADYITRDGIQVSSGTVTVPQVSSVTLIPRIGGVQLHWRNPSARRFEWVDVYRNEVNSFGDSDTVLVKTTRNDEYFDSLSPGVKQFYWWQTRDFRGHVSSVYPGEISSFGVAALFPVHQDPEYVFLEDFNYKTVSEFSERWERVDGDLSLITFPQSGITGGQVLQTSGDEAWFSSKTRIPYDPEAMYRMEVVARMVTSHAARNQYFGFTGYRADAVTPISATSLETIMQAHYFALYAYSPSSEGVWESHAGHIRGYMPWPRSGSIRHNVAADPGQAARMHQHTRYVSPMFRLGSNNGAGVQEIDVIRVSKLPPGRNLVYDPIITLSSNWIGGYFFNDTDSFDLISGPTSWDNFEFNPSDLDGRFGVLHLNPSSQALGNVYYAIHERFRPKAHAKFYETNSGTYDVSALIYLTAGGASVSANVLGGFVIYTEAGSVAGRTGAANLGLPADSAWTGLRASVTFNNSLVNTDSYPPPYFVAPTILLPRATNGPVSWALAALDMFAITG